MALVGFRAMVVSEKVEALSINIPLRAHSTASAASMARFTAVGTSSTALLFAMSFSSLRLMVCASRVDEDVDDSDFASWLCSRPSFF
eukprot:4875158-Alexandrium_andersonii.AAC.1